MSNGDPKGAILWYEIKERDPARHLPSTAARALSRQRMLGRKLPHWLWM
jgi:hypothetical protein